jgi:predicted SAM-dependent methyltransferase
MTEEIKLVKVDLCCGIHKPEGFIGVDHFSGDNVDIVADLTQRFPFEDNAVDILRAHDALEHLPDRIHTMNEIWRICKPGATVDIFVPSTDGRGAFQDPTHVSYWNINSFLYYSVDHPAYYELCQRYGFQGGFRIEKIYNLSSFENIVHVQAILKALK